MFDEEQVFTQFKAPLFILCISYKMQTWKSLTNTTRLKWWKSTSLVTIQVKIVHQLIQQEKCIINSVTFLPNYIWAESSHNFKKTPIKENSTKKLNCNLQKWQGHENQRKKVIVLGLRSIKTYNNQLWHMTLNSIVLTLKDITK